MKKVAFASARFLTSALFENEWPTLKGSRGNLLPELALVGRSNVGKSSLINALTGQKHLAKTSSIPGKTQRINFFLIDDELVLVDLPGYGYAKVPKGSAKEWSEAIDAYFTKRSSLQLILLLVDSRRDLSPEDLQIIDWARAQNRKLLVIFTKTDKLSSFEKKQLLTEKGAFLEDSIAFSIHDKQALPKLISAIQKRICL